MSKTIYVNHQTNYLHSKIYTDYATECTSSPSYQATLLKLKVQCSNLARIQARPSALAAEQEHRLLTKQVPEPPGRIEAQRLAPSIQRHGFLELHPNLGAELAEVLDGAVVNVGR